MNQKLKIVIFVILIIGFAIYGTFEGLYKSTKEEDVGDLAISILEDVRNGKEFFEGTDIIDNRLTGRIISNFAMYDSLKGRTTKTHNMMNFIHLYRLQYLTFPSNLVNYKLIEFYEEKIELIVEKIKVPSKVYCFKIETKPPTKYKYFCMRFIYEYGTEWRLATTWKVENLNSH